MEFSDGVSTLLDVQYRMAADIMNWASSAMYDGKLKAGPKVGERLLSDLPKTLNSTDLLSNPMLLIDTAGSLMHEAIDEESRSESKYNLGEADLVL